MTEMDQHQRQWRAFLTLASSHGPVAIESQCSYKVSEVRSKSRVRFGQPAYVFAEMCRGAFLWGVCMFELCLVDNLDGLMSCLVSLAKGFGL